MKHYKFILILTALFTLGSTARAQFTMTGEEPFSVKWSRMDTPNFRIIFPTGLDSLAKVYGTELETARTPLSWSSGLTIGQSYKSKMPVILHPYYSVANAMVTWAPKRMDIYTMPDPDAPTPLPWARELAIHEGRHATQMQFGAKGKYKILHYLTGEMLAGSLAGVFPGPTILEGDAVTTETALSSSGRGRQGSFLSYMMPSFDNGDWRNYWQWTYGSQKRYTPDYYRIGYMLISGTRVFFSDSTFTKDYFYNAVRRPRFFNLQKTIKEATGADFSTTVRLIEESYSCLWNAEASLREPFMPARQVTQKPNFDTFYMNGFSMPDGSILTLKNGIATTTCLVNLNPDGSENRLRCWSGTSSNLHFDAASSRVYFTETVPSRRWDLQSFSRIRYIDSENPQKIHNLTLKGRYLNSVPSPDGKTVAACDYPVSGGSAIILLRASDGTVERKIAAPDSIQFTEPVWIGERLFTAGLSDHGMGVYEITSGSVRSLAEPQPVELSTLAKWDDSHISFVCDRTGVNEMYLLDVNSASLTQATSTRYGISSPILNCSADTLYYSSLAASDKPESYKQGSMMYATAVKDLPMLPARFSDIHRYPVADALTAQEKALGGWDGNWNLSDSIDFSPVKKYRKVRAPHVHSWAPIFFNYNNISSISEDTYYESASLGATALFQNLFSTGYGFVGYSFHEDPLDDSKWRNTLHASYIYTGLYPVIELSADFNDRDREQILRVAGTKNDKVTYFTAGSYKDSTCCFTGSAKIYVPLHFSSGGVSRGLIPQIKATVTNDLYDDGIYKWKYGKKKNGKEGWIQNGTLVEGSNSILTTFDCSVRGYVTRSTASSQIFPRLGIGAETGFHTHPGHSKAFSNSMYWYTYGYLPGFTEDQGLKMTFGAESRFGKSKYSLLDGILVTMPRGFVDSNIKSIQNKNVKTKFKVTADYAIPFLPVDWSGLSPMTYVRNFVVTPFCDYSYQIYDSNPDLNLNADGFKGESLMSFGFDLTAHLSNWFWMPYDTEIGIRYARNYWQHLDSFSIKNLNHNYVELIFSINL